MAPPKQLTPKKPKGGVKAPSHVKHVQKKTPGKKPKTPAAAAPPQPPLPAPLPPDWVGVDKRDLPGPPPKKGQPRRGDPGWMETLLQNSQLRVCGPYATGPILSGHQKDEFTDSSLQTSRDWMPNIQVLSDQGWGIVFWYVGYSVRGGEPAVRKDKKTKKRQDQASYARGQLHGVHVRTILKELGDAWAGAVVIIDNEDSVTESLPKTLIEYYEGILDEMTRPDPNLPALRPGFYAHTPSTATKTARKRGNQTPIAPLLQRRPDLFVWAVIYDHAQGSTSQHPFEPNIKNPADPLRIDVGKRVIEPFAVTPHGVPPWVCWPFGRQFRRYSGKIPPPKSATARRLPSWKAYPEWDFDTSLVRNPAFPAAEPRIAAKAFGADVVLLRGTFRDAEPGVRLPSMQIEEVRASSPSALETDGERLVEPEAPLVLARWTTSLMLLTVLRGDLLASALRTAQGTWSPIAAMPFSHAPLRRIRALAAARRGAEDLHAFFVGIDNQLHAVRWAPATKWAHGGPVPGLRVHPFSALCASSRGGDTVDAFLLDEEGFLTTAYWARWFSKWPGYKVERIEKTRTPALLRGGSLACAAPNVDELMVFGVGTDLRLWTARFTNGKGWGPLEPLGQPEHRLSPHTRLAVNVTRMGDEVEVVALNDAGDVVSYSMIRSNGIWGPVGPGKVPPPPPAPAKGTIAPPASGPRARADGWRINPFGDLAIARPEGSLDRSVYCAGLRGGTHQVLARRLTPRDEWEYYRV